MKILISYLTKTNSGAIDSVTKAFYDELRDIFNIKAVYRNRIFGVSKNKYIRNIQAIVYTILQYINWLYNIIWFRPFIVHYPVTSFNNFGKSMFFLTSAKFLGVKKTIGHLHGGAFKDFFDSLNSLKQKIAIKKLNKLDCFIVLSPSWEKYAKEKGFNQNIEIIHNPIAKDFHDYFSNGFSKQFEVSNFLNLLYVGRLEQQKGFIDLFYSVYNLDFVRLEILGNYVNTTEKNRLENIFNNYEITSVLNFNGYLTGYDKMLKFSKADVLVLPSYFENFPLVVLEAACANCAIIASKVGAMPDYFTDMKNIIFIEPGDVQSLKNSIELLKDNPELVKTLGNNARSLYEKVLNRDIAISKLRDIYYSIQRKNNL